jgi:integrase
MVVTARARGLSRSTLENSYGYSLRHVFIPWCNGEGIRQPSGVSPRSLDRLSAQLLDRGGKRGELSRHSVHTYMRAINRFLTWAKEEGEEVDARAQLPKLPKQLIDVLSRDEIQSMEDAAKTERDKLIIRILADTGIRVGELVGLRTTDIVQRDRNHFLRVRGKGSRERLVPVPQLYRRVQRYAERSRPVDASSNRVFISHRRGPAGEYQALTTSGVLQLLRNVAQEARIEKRVYPHLFRHSYATWALSRGMHPIMLAQILGHSSLAMIQTVYSHLSPADAYDAMLRALTTGE